MNQEFQSQDYWSQAWQRHIKNYLTSPPRTGYWVKTFFPDKNWRFLEIGGGSCRDSLYLANQGFKVIGTDFEESPLEYLRSHFPDAPIQLQCEDAFALSFSDKSLDVSFHNGLWVCFEDDQNLIKLFKEQVRVTKKYVVIIVHNAQNTQMVQSFKEKSKHDSLYNIRFFTFHEVKELIKKSGVPVKKISIKKFGGFFDKFYSLSEKKRKWLSFFPFESLVPHLYYFQRWKNTERIACLIEL